MPHQFYKEIIHPEYLQYAASCSDPEAEVLHALNTDTVAHVPGASMLTGHVEGLLLQFISKLITPQKVLEIGTYTGYSAICLAAGLAEGGRIHTIDVDDRWQEMRLKYWRQAGLEDNIIQHIGQGTEVIPATEGPFDLVYIDADKKNYGIYFDLALEKMKSGGVLIADNVLFHGEVTLPIETQSNAAKYIHAFNQKIAADDRVEKVMLTVRDGVTLIRKK